MPGDKFPAPSAALAVETVPRVTKSSLLGPEGGRMPSSDHEIRHASELGMQSRKPHTQAFLGQ
jgi:hypothetical protein